MSAREDPPNLRRWEEWGVKKALKQGYRRKFIFPDFSWFFRWVANSHIPDNTVHPRASPIPPTYVGESTGTLSMFCAVEGELRATWSVSSTSSDERDESDADDDSRPQFGTRSHAYKATRVFYRNRPERQAQETTTNPSGSDSEPGHRRQPDEIKSNRQSQTADHLVTNNRQNAADRSNHRNNSNNRYLNFNKSAAKYRSEAGGAAGKTADAYRRDNYSERRYVSRDTARQQRGNGRYNDNDKSKRGTETDKKDSSLNDATDREPQGDMRYSRNRRTPKKWQLLPLPASPRHNGRPPPEPLGPVPPADDRRPYRRNLPPRMLAKLKQSGTPAVAAVAQDPVAVSSEDAGKDSNVDVPQTKVEDTSGPASQQKDGKILYRPIVSF